MILFHKRSDIPVSVDRERVKTRVRGRASISARALEITKFRQTVDRKFDVLNKVHPGWLAQFFRRNFTRHPGTTTDERHPREGEIARKHVSSRAISREKEKSHDGFIKLNVSSTDKASQGAASLATGSFRRNHESWPRSALFRQSNSHFAVKLNFPFLYRLFY